ncbi:MAG: toprim domain-containing protein [Betaproteobacteria bacterium]|nr:toprim domain-containing protein [Betaproteobacteria bacterium]
MKDSHMNTPELAACFGLHRAGREWRGTCPACGYGSDAFTLSTGKDGRPLLWCASCQDNDALSTILRGVGAGADLARRDDRAAAQKALEAREKSRERARVIWAGAGPVTADNPAGRYLARRALGRLIGNATLRYRADVPHPTGGRHPALVALVQDAADNVLGVHRTYLATDGHKAHLEPVKASLGPIWGGAIRLAPAAPEIVIGEGIESSASAKLLLGLPSWAAISAGNLGKGLILPPEVQSVVIAADDDGVNAQGRNPGLEAAEAAAARWQAEGRKVRIIKPKTPGKDFNDILQARAAGEAA